MIIDALTVASSEWVPEAFEKEEVTPEEIDAEVENQDGLEDPIRLYLHEIGRVPLLSGISIREEGDSWLGDFTTDPNVMEPIDGTIRKLLKEQIQEVLSTLTARE